MDKSTNPDNKNQDIKAETFVRYDVQTFGKMTRTDEGFLQGKSPIAKVGVLTYVKPDGTTIKEFVPEEVLFNKDSLNSLKLKPLTNTHPKEKLLDSKITKERSVGSIGETTEKIDSHLVVSMVVTDAATISDIEKGRVELSPGYTCTVQFTPGEFNGERYDAVQTSRTYNHVAICDTARGGRSIRMNLDSNECFLDTEDRMVSYKIDGIEYQAAPEVVNYINKLQGETKEATLKISALQAKNDEQKAELEKTKNDSKKILDSVPGLVLERVNLISLATKLGVKNDSVNISAEDIMKQIILAKHPKADLTGKDSTYLKARVDAIVESLETDTLANQITTGKVKVDAKDNLDPVTKARLDSEERIKNGYKNEDKGAK